MSENNNGGKAYSNIMLISQLGISVMVPIFMCLFAGIFLDDKFSTCLTVPLLFLGIAAGGRNAYIMAKAALDKETKAKAKQEQDELNEILDRYNVPREDER